MFLRDMCSAETSSKNTLGIKRLHYFLKKNNFFSLFGNFRVKNHFLLVCPVWDSLQVVIDFLSGNINIDCTWKNRCIMSKKFYVWHQIVGKTIYVYQKLEWTWKRPLHHTWFNQFSKRILAIKTFWHLLSIKLWKSVSKWSWTPIVFNLYIKPLYQTLSKAFDVPKNSKRVFEDRKLSKWFVNFVH